MKKATASSILGIALLLAVGVLAQSQPPAKVPRIGFIGGSPATDSARIEALRQGLRELG